MSRPELPFGESRGGVVQLARHRHLEYIDKIRKDGVNVTQWESDFIGDLSERLGRGLELTTRQEQILDRIYAERTP